MDVYQKSEAELEEEVRQQQLEDKLGEREEALREVKVSLASERARYKRLVDEVEKTRVGLEAQLEEAKQRAKDALQREVKEGTLADAAAAEKELSEEAVKAEEKLWSEEREKITAEAKREDLEIEKATLQVKDAQQTAATVLKRASEVAQAKAAVQVAKGVVEGATLGLRQAAEKTGALMTEEAAKSGLARAAAHVIARAIEKQTDAIAVDRKEKEAVAEAATKAAVRAAVAGVARAAPAVVGGPVKPHEAYAHGLPVPAVVQSPVAAEAAASIDAEKAISTAATKKAKPAQLAQKRGNAFEELDTGKEKSAEGTNAPSSAAAAPAKAVALVDTGSALAKQASGAARPGDGGEDFFVGPSFTAEVPQVFVK